MFILQYWIYKTMDTLYKWVDLVNVYASPQIWLRYTWLESYGHYFCW